MSFTAGAGTRFVVTSTASQSSGTVLTGPITATAGTATTDTPAFNITQTWNAGAVTFTGLRFNVTDTASAAGSLLMDLQVGGTSKFAFNKNATITFTGSGASSIFGVTAFGDVFTINRTLSSTAGGLQLSGGSSSIFGRTNSSSIFMAALAQIGFGSTSDNTGTNDAFITRDAAGTLAQRNGVNAQTFRVYNTFTDASNYERGFISWSAVSNRLGIGTEAAGTGSKRALDLYGSSIQFRPLAGNNNAAWEFNNSGHFIASTDNTYDIGASGANRPRNVYIGGFLSILSYIEAGGAQYIGWGGRSLIRAPSNGNLTLLNSAENAFGLLQFGGTTASFPALKRNTTFLETKLADDSAYAPHAMQYLDVTDGITAPASASGRARIYVDTADGDLKVIFDDGTVKTIVTDTP